MPIPSPSKGSTKTYDCIVIGAGQAGLAASYHLNRLWIEHLVLDANEESGGAWGHRWDALTMRDVHGVADLPGSPAPLASDLPANQVIPRYFMLYEKTHRLPVLRPVRVKRVANAVENERLLALETSAGDFTARTLINASGTWTRPFLPYYPGIQVFRGRQVHTATYRGPESFIGERVLVVGAGASAVQFIGALAGLAQDVFWATRRPPVWQEGTSIRGLEAVTWVEDRTVQGLPPVSVVSATGLVLREQERKAQDLGYYERRLPMPVRFLQDGALWASEVSSPLLEGGYLGFDSIIWATGFRPALSHLAPLKLRSARGGIQLRRVENNVQAATSSVVDGRINFVGYGPSASTVGASRAAREAARAVQKYLKKDLEEL